MLKFTIIHILFIVLCTLLGGYVLLWFFHHIEPNPFPNKEFYLLLLIYLVILSVTAWVLKTKYLLKIHRAIGFCLPQFKFILLAVLIAVLLWIADYYFQSKLLYVNIQEQANIWYMQQSNLTAAIFSTVICAPIIEEMLFRGIFFQYFNKYINRLMSAILLSGIFTVIHFSLEQSIPLMVASMLYFFLTYQSNSIVPAIIAHIINNAMTFASYYILVNN